ncbi:MAG: glycosyl hydrolase [Planctomycetota bacterium]|nr:MAG: glycosyl hydrolase [Planctomycetota bacterium]
MFAEFEGSRRAIGDVDVVYHEGLYHLFHLVLPNHDYIAHAVSTDGIRWRRVNNALFIADPGSWDDLMLWTMHVSADPHRPGCWRMFYTGLSRREQGRIQRIGMAVSDDLFHWRKAPTHWTDDRGAHDPQPVQAARRVCQQQVASRHYSPVDATSCFPLEPDPRFYESRLDEGRAWVSFRDPYFFHDGQTGWLIASARVKDGPVIRRGCVGVLREAEPNRFESLPPLHHPGLYDDVEVPNLLQIDGEYYLIGSIREDAKIRYWHTDRLDKPWRSYYDNVLMPRGNYAGRVCRDGRGWLFWCFYSADAEDRGTNNLLPAPKRLIRTPEGLLRVTSYERFDEWLAEPLDTRCVHTLKQGLGQQFCRVHEDNLELKSEAGFQAFVFEHQVDHFRLRAQMRLKGKGKCGLVFRVDPATHDGYYLSLDLLKGVAQLRRWQTGAAGTGERMMQFRELQSGNWYTDTRGEAQVQLLAFGSYLELSIDGRIVLSLADRTFETGLAGFALESAHLELGQVQLTRMHAPQQHDEQLVSGTP